MAWAAVCVCIYFWIFFWVSVTSNSHLTVSKHIYLNIFIRKLEFTCLTTCLRSVYCFPAQSWSPVHPRQHWFLPLIYSSHALLYYQLCQLTLQVTWGMWNALSIAAFACFLSLSVSLCLTKCSVLCRCSLNTCLFGGCLHVLFVVPSKQIDSTWFLMVLIKYFE